MKITNNKLKGMDLSFNGKSISFDEFGVSEDIPKEEAERLLTLPFYKAVDTSKSNGTDKVKETITKDEKLETEADSEPTNDVIDLEKLSVSELKEMLKEKEIEFDNKAKKAELIELLK